MIKKPILNHYYSKKFGFKTNFNTSNNIQIKEEDKNNVLNNKIYTKIKQDEIKNNNGNVEGKIQRHYIRRFYYKTSNNRALFTKDYSQRDVDISINENNKYVNSTKYIKINNIDKKEKKNRY